MKILLDEKYPLDMTGINQVITQIDSRLEDSKIASKELLRLKLSAEEILLNWQEMVEEAKIQLRMLQRGKRIEISMMLCGIAGWEHLNPLNTDTEMGSSEISGDLLSMIGVSWNYRYSDGQNCVNTCIRTKTSSGIQNILVAMALAVVMGMLSRLLPQGISHGVQQYLVNPLFDTFIRALSVVVGPMMFFSVMWGMLGIGNPRLLGKIGKKIMLHFVRQDALPVLPTLCLVFLFYPVQMAATQSDGNPASEILNMFYDIVPSDFVSPFIEGNTLQIVFMSVVIGVVIMLLGGQTDQVTKLVGQINLIIQKIMLTITNLIPVFVFLSVYRITVSNQLSDMKVFGRAALLFLLVSMTNLICHVLLTAHKCHMTLGKTIKSILPSYLIALATSSSAAAYGAAEDNLSQNFHVKKSMIDFALPLGVVTMMSNFPFWFLLIGCTCMESVGKPITPVILCTLSVLAVLMGIACPPIPGGTLGCYMIMMTQLGLPMELLAVITAVDLLIDFPATAGDVAMVQMQIAVDAQNEGMLQTRQKQSQS